MHCSTKLPTCSSRFWLRSAPSSSDPPRGSSPSVRAARCTGMGSRQVVRGTGREAADEQQFAATRRPVALEPAAERCTGAFEHVHPPSGSGAHREAASGSRQLPVASWLAVSPALLGMPAGTRAVPQTKCCRWGGLKLRLLGATHFERAVAETAALQKQQGNQLLLTLLGDAFSSGSLAPRSSSSRCSSACCCFTREPCTVGTVSPAAAGPGARACNGGENLGAGDAMHRLDGSGCWQKSGRAGRMAGTSAGRRGRR